MLQLRVNSVGEGRSYIFFYFFLFVIEAEKLVYRGRWRGEEMAD